MTRETAINKLNWALDNNTIEDVQSAYEYIIALKMAIKALEQKPCNDTVSREDAKSFLYERLNRLSDDELYDIFSVIIDDMYNELPPVQPKSGWIPVSERLPEEEFNRRTVYRYPCLVTRKASHDPVSPERTYVAEQYFNGKIFVNTMGCDCHKDVIAWMPLPKPMKVGKSN